MLGFSNCKINIGLNVTAKRADGYHDIETVFYPVFWNDILEVISHPKGIVEGACFENSGLIVPGEPSDNLCLKAYQLLQKHHHIGPCHILLHKILPTGAGLGGGSSNAAFTLNLLNTVFNIGLNTKQLKTYAAELGSDCSFFIDNKPAFAHGKGDLLSPISLDLSKYYILLVNPALHVSTAAAYADVMPKKPLLSLKKIIEQPIEGWKHSIVNDFEKSVFRKYPELENIKSKLYSMGAVYSAMSGSGSTIYGIFKEEPTEDAFPNYITWVGELKVRRE